MGGEEIVGADFELARRKYLQVFAAMRAVQLALREEKSTVRRIV
jgi:hypothetical protein